MLFICFILSLPLRKYSCFLFFLDGLKKIVDIFQNVLYDNKAEFQRYG